MKVPKKLVVRAAICIVLGLLPAAPSVADTATDHSQLAMMDDDKMSMKPDASNSSSPMNTGQSSGQPQNMSGGRMNDDKMKMEPQHQMRDCQGAGCQEGSSMMQMMQVMDKMMRGQMNSSSASAAASGPADVTERLEGRIAFLKAELQISDKQLADWNNLADALRAGRQHLLEARKVLVMDDRVPGGERLEHYERHLSERLEAIKSARSAFTRLYVSLSDIQKQTADAILLPFLATF
jgi:LTXXQ motif family protein